MIWSRVILDGLAMAIVFNMTIAVLWLLMPNTFSSMLPKEIKTLAPQREKQQVKRLASIIYPLYIGMFAWMIISTYQAGVQGFWNLFWTGYIEMFFVNMGDLIGLDWFFRKQFKDKIMIKGTEQCKAWEDKEWMMTLGIPEHILMWPLIVCPLVGLICGGVGMLLR